MTFCAVKSSLRAYHADQVRLDWLQEARTDHATFLTQPGQACDPLSTVHLAEAMTEASASEWEGVAELLRLGSRAAAAAEMETLSRAYWMDAALRIAAIDITEAHE